MQVSLAAACWAEHAAGKTGRRPIGGGSLSCKPCIAVRRNHTLTSKNCSTSLCHMSSRALGFLPAASTAQGAQDRTSILGSQQCASRVPAAGQRQPAQRQQRRRQRRWEQECGAMRPDRSVWQGTLHSLPWHCCTQRRPLHPYIWHTAAACPAPYTHTLPQHPIPWHAALAPLPRLSRQCLEALRRQQQR
jgi:hypothetical protein